jgi:hypothetical protein
MGAYGYDNDDGQGKHGENAQGARRPGPVAASASASSATGPFAGGAGAGVRVRGTHALYASPLRAPAPKAAGSSGSGGSIAALTAAVTTIAERLARLQATVDAEVADLAAALEDVRRQLQP